MKIFIIEDDFSVVSILEDIVERNSLGQICGDSCDDGLDFDKIMAINPDLILVDLLMPEKDGIQVVRELKERGCQSKFIMISQVSSKEIIAKAYLAGIDFFINKPINLIEVRQVIGNISRQLENEQALKTIRNVFSTQMSQPAPAVQEQDVQRRRIQYILSQLGMAGEKGAEDIIDMCMYLINLELKVSQIGVGALCAELSDSPKSMEQRVRRTVERGLSHLASLGLEDYGNELFTRYASVLYPFPEVRAEMDHLRGRGTGGKVNLKKFLDGMLVLSEDY